MRVIKTPELAVLANELKEFNGFYIDRFYEVAEDRFRIKLSKKGAQANLQIILSRTVNRTNYVEKQEAASNFSLAVRKRIEGFMIDDAVQYNDDRILLFKLHKGEAEMNMIIEMFGKGNLILTNGDMIIQLAYVVNDFKDRKIRPGERYLPPQKKFAGEMEIPRGKPAIYRDESGKAVDYSFGELAGLKAQHFDTLQEALDVFYYENPVVEKREASKNEMLIEELLASIAKQEKSLNDIDKEIAQNKEKGEYLMKNIAEINSLIKAMQANRRMTREELQKLFQKLKILNVDLKDKTVIVDA